MIPGQSDSPARGSMSNSPQNSYRSYDGEKVFTDPQSWNNDRVSHERLSHFDVIARANGGGPTDNSSVGHFVDDGKGTTP